MYLCVRIPDHTRQQYSKTLEGTYLALPIPLECRPPDKAWTWDRFIMSGHPTYRLQHLYKNPVL